MAKTDYPLTDYMALTTLWEVFEFRYNPGTYYFWENITHSINKTFNARQK